MEVVYSQQGHNDDAIRTAVESAIAEMQQVTGIDTASDNRLSSGWQLSNAYPNPFNAQTRFTYTVPERSGIHLSILDVRGRTVRTLVSGTKKEARYTITWDGTDNRGYGVSSGIYFLRLKSSSTAMTRKVMVVR